MDSLVARNNSDSSVLSKESCFIDVQYCTVPQECNNPVFPIINEILASLSTDRGNKKQLSPPNRVAQIPKCFASLQAFS